MLATALAKRQGPLAGHASAKKYVAFSARNKAQASPHASPSLSQALAPTGSQAIVSMQRSAPTLRMDEGSPDENVAPSHRWSGSDASHAVAT